MWAFMNQQVRNIFARASASAATMVLIAGVVTSSASAAATSYIPSMKDWMSIQEALHNYHFGLDRHDNKVMASAFTEDGALVAENENGVETRLQGRGKIAALGFMGVAPPPEGPPPPPGERWHFTGDDHYVFASSTRATHYSYWLDLLVPSTGDRTSKLGTPGHYEDILVKQKDGRWLFSVRKIVIGKK
jgi:hypothetical protein